MLTSHSSSAFLGNQAALLLAMTAFCPVWLSAQTTVWTAGADLAANEASAFSTSNPNATVPAWSYGWRGSATGTTLTLFPSSDHVVNVNGYAGFDGFSHAATSGPYFFVNTSLVNVVLNNGAGNLTPVAPGEIMLDPSFSNQFTVTRWTAPAAGNYAITANWQDIDPYGGNGISVDLVLNGTSVFSALLSNGGSTTLGGALNLTLASGDLLDFVVGTRGDATYDSTSFNAKITAVPETSTSATLLALCAIGFARWRRIR